MSASAPYLQMRDIRKRFPGVAALSGAELDAYAGEAVAVMGANGAGKSTLMNILGGEVARDGGQIVIDGRACEFRSPIDSLNAGVAFVRQELSSLPTMSVAENILIDSFPTRYGIVNWSEAERQAGQILRRLGSSLDPRAPVGGLSTGDRQIVEIARALRRNPKILIFDEPTSSLSARERERVFDVVKALKTQGVAVIYITHFLNEIFEICERAVIMRNGETVFTGLIHDLSARDVVTHMMGGYEVEARLSGVTASQAPVILQVDGLSRDGALQDIHLSVRQGEILGIWGLLRSGRTELLRAIAGLDPIDAGTLHWRNEAGELSPISPKALQGLAGIVTEDRRGDGLFLPLPVSENIALPNLGRISAFGMISESARRRVAVDLVGRLGVKVSSVEQTADTLSGGNQQKVVFAKWLVDPPKLFLLDEPTRGLDVGAKAEILKLIVELAAAGAAILLVSSEVEELIGVSHRYVVMSQGRLIGELPGSASGADLLSAVSAQETPGRTTP